ncbi:MAG: rhodanese-like domain-containing protein [Thiomargarita sp.]|nr:rhodanese-like domain-containing protein [Thiomargarita sp.]
MEQLIEFVGNHQGLFFAFSIVLGLLFWSLVSEQISGIKSLPPSDAVLLMNHENALIIDVREENEYVEGHILDAMHIPLSTLTGKINRLEKYRTRPIIASCTSGGRSGRACRTLKKDGFENVYNLKGGVVAWKNSNLPLTKGKH